MKARTTLEIILLASILAAIPLRLAAQAATGAGTSAPPTQAAQAAPPSAKPALANFAWLTGRWQGTWGPRAAQQSWSAPKAGVMLGTFQLAEGDKTLVLELFTLVEDSDGIKLYLRHFTPSLMNWEKSSPTTLSLESADPKSIVFMNPIDGEPKRDIFQRVDADTYVLRSEIVPEKGDPQVTEITYHRVFDGPPPKHHGSKSKSH